VEARQPALACLDYTKPFTLVSNISKTSTLHFHTLAGSYNCGHRRSCSLSRIHTSREFVGYVPTTGRHPPVLVQHA